MTYAGRVTGRVILGIAASQATWAQYAAQIGTVYARRFFYDTWAVTKITARANAIIAAGQQPFISLKVPGNRWADVSAGLFNTDLNTIIAQCAAANGVVYVIVHHEPQGDGNLVTWAAMQTYLSTYFAGQPQIVLVACGNGFWLKPVGGLTDAQIAAGPFPASLLNTLATNGDVPGADFYDRDKVGLRTQDGLRGVAAWCDRTGVTDFVVPEFGCYTAAGITESWTVMRDRVDLFGAAMYFNSAANSRADWLLTGDRLTAFQAALVASATGSSPPTPPATPPNDDFAAADPL